MAFVQDTQNDPNAMQPSTTGTNAPMNQLPQTSSGGTGGATGANTSTSGGPQGAPSVPNSTKAPPVQNLQDYLTANAPQAVGMGGAIAQNISTQGQQVTGDINADQQAFDQSVQTSNVAPNQDLINQAANNPSEFVQDPNNVQQFQAQENANYTGPTSFESSAYDQPLTQEVDQFQQNTPNTNTPAGVLQLVTGQEQNPTLGMENLDALLLGGTPGATQAITQAEAPYASLGQSLTNVGTTEDANIASAQANDLAAPAAVQNAFFTGPNAEVPAWEQGLQGEETNATNAVNAYNQTVPGYDTEQGNLGNIAQNWNNFQYSVPNFGIYTTPISAPGSPSEAAVNAPSLSSVATPQDYATEAALSQLLGTSLGTTPIDQSTVGQAGTFQAPGAVPNLQPQAQSELDNLLSAYNQTYKNDLNPAGAVDQGAYGALLAALNKEADPLEQQLEGYGANAAV